MGQKRKPLPGVKQCQCGSRSFVNGVCAMCKPRAEQPTQDNGMGWLGKDFADLYKKHAG